MINFDGYADENKTQHNLKWPYIPHYPDRILILGISGSGKTDAILIKYICTLKIHMKQNINI